jgi:hypothetical protein
MTRVEQAIVTCAQGDQPAGYQVAAASPGLSAADRRELSAWGPGHDCLAESGPDAAAVNFFPLASGAYCVSRTVQAGGPRSGRGGRPAYTRCLVVPPETLAQFSNHPLALARTAAAAGAFDVLPDPQAGAPPEALAPLDLCGRAPPVDQPALEALSRQVGPWRLALLVQAALDSSCLAVGGAASVEQIVSGLLDCLPPWCRMSFSFSTGLKYACRRPLRILPLPSDAAARQWLAHQPGVAMLDLAAEQPGRGALVDDWARLVERVLSCSQVPLLAAEFSTPRPDLTPADLPVMGLQLLESLDAAVLKRAAGDCRRDHAAHRRFEKSLAADAAAARTSVFPSAQLDVDSPQVLEKLEALDDVVFEAMGGRAEAIRRLGALWPAVRDELGIDLVGQSREQYLRYALSIWEDCIGDGVIRDPARAVHALDVLCVLFDEV